MPGSRRNSGRGIEVGPLIQQQLGGQVSSPPPDINEQQQRHFMDQRVQELYQNDNNSVTRSSSLRARHGSIMDLDRPGTNSGGGMGGYQNSVSTASMVGPNSNMTNTLGFDQEFRATQRRASSSTLIQYNNYVT